MKKLLSALLLAPISISACTTTVGGGTSGGGNTDGGNGSTPDTQTPITSLDIFGNENVSVETVNNWFTNGHADNLKTGVFGAAGPQLAYNMQKGTTDLYSFTNIDGQTVSNKSLAEGYGDFKNKLSMINSHNGPSNPSAVPANYSSLVKSGQAINGSTLPGNTEMIPDTDFMSKPINAPTNTLVSAFDLRSFASLIDTNFGQTAFGNSVNITFTAGAPLFGGATQTPISISNTAALANVQGIDFGPTPFNGQLATQFYQPTNFNQSHSSTFTLDAMGSIALCHASQCTLPSHTIKAPNGQPFISWYVERYRENPFSNWPTMSSENGNTWALRLAQFDGDGNKQFEIGKFNIGYPISGFGSLAAAHTAFATGLEALEATTTINPNDGGFQVTTQGSSDGMEANHKKGISIKATATHWYFKADNLNTRFNFTDTELRPAFDYWAQNSLLPNLTTSTGASFEIKMNGTDYDAYSDLDLLYKDACLKAKEMIEAGNATFTGSCPA